MKTIEIVTEDELDDLLESDDFMDESLLAFATKCIDLYKKRNNEWLTSEDEQIARGMTVEERDKFDDDFFDDYWQIEKPEIRRIKKALVDALRANDAKEGFMT